MRYSTDRRICKSLRIKEQVAYLLVVYFPWAVEYNQRLLRIKRIFRNKWTDCKIKVVNSILSWENSISKLINHYFKILSLFLLFYNAQNNYCVYFWAKNDHVSSLENNIISPAMQCEALFSMQHIGKCCTKPQ